MFAAVHRLELFIKRVDTNDNIADLPSRQVGATGCWFFLLSAVAKGVSHSECQWHDRGRAGPRRDVRHHDALGGSRRALEPAQVSYSFVCVARLYLALDMAGPLSAELRASGTS